MKFQVDTASDNKTMLHFKNQIIRLRAWNLMSRDLRSHNQQNLLM